MSVKLESSDGKVFTVERKVVELSQTIKHMLDDLEGIESAIPLPNVEAPVLEKILAWCEYHTKNPDAPIPETDKYRTDNIIQWDQDFMKVEMHMLFDLILAANYLDIKLLLELGLKTVANMMKGKNAEEIKTIFAIPADKLAKIQQKMPMMANNTVTASA